MGLLAGTLESYMIRSGHGVTATHLLQHIFHTFTEADLDR